MRRMRRWTYFALNKNTEDFSRSLGTTYLDSRRIAGTIRANKILKKQRQDKKTLVKDKKTSVLSFLLYSHSCI